MYPGNTMKKQHWSMALFIGHPGHLLDLWTLNISFDVCNHQIQYRHGWPKLHNWGHKLVSLMMPIICCLFNMFDVHSIMSILIGSKIKVNLPKEHGWDNSPIMVITWHYFNCLCHFARVFLSGVCHVWWKVILNSLPFIDAWFSRA